VSTLLCISQTFPPERTPTGIRAGKLLERLRSQWDIEVLTECSSSRSHENMRVHAVPARRPRRLLATLRRIRMGKLVEMLVWPDESIFWLLPAIRAGRRAIRDSSPEAIVVFMMPYSSGLAGIVLSRLSGLPLILNLDDSPTCIDMHPHFPTRLHHRLAQALEDLYVRRADAIVYVSQTNLQAVRDRNPAASRLKFHLVRYGADPEEHPPPPSPSAGDRFQAVYVGAMSGWWTLIESNAPSSTLKRLYGHWTRLGRHVRTELDQRTSSPAYVGGAMREAIANHSDWEGRLGLTVYDNTYPTSVVQRALAGADLSEVVSIHEPVPHAQVAGILAAADLLFLALPNRDERLPGGRISAKTYEYLVTDRPILAAVPRGESWDYLRGKPGVWLVAPDDRESMREILERLVAAKLAGEPLAFDRGALREELSYDTRARELAQAIRAGIAWRAAVGERREGG
jgi:Glycosyl transferase 4-like domain